ncbi:MAG TPA: hypothetical protein VIP30_06390 [Stenotrophomonas sp.]
MRDKKQTGKPASWWLVILAALAALLAAWFAGSSRHSAVGPERQAVKPAPLPANRPTDRPTSPSTPQATPTTPLVRLGAKAYLLDGYPEIPEGQAKAVIDQLDDRARQGDSHAALLIYLKIDQCLRAFRDQNDPDTLVVAAEALGSVEAALEEQGKRRSQCEGLSEQDYSRRGEWLSLAADLGNPFAQLTYSMLPANVLGSLAEVVRQPERLFDYKRRAVTYLHRAAASGNVNALDRLAQVYSDGYLAPVDPVLARSYQLAARRANPGTERPDAEEAENKLDSKQRAEAARMAKEIYHECCEIK